METHEVSFTPAGIFLTDPSSQVNPLRPYHRDSFRVSLPPAANGSSPNPPSRPSGSTSSSFTEMFPDLDYGEYMGGGSPTMAEMVKKLFDQSIWNYTSVLMAHPFEVAKITLQCYDAGTKGSETDGVNGSRRTTQPEPSYSESESDSDAPSYFSPTSPEETPTRRRRRPARPSRTSSQFQDQPTTIVLTKPDSVLEILGQVWQREGVFGVWKGTNTAFVHGILLKTIETWTRGLLSAILNIPDPTLLSSSFGPRALGGPSVLESSSPFASLSVVVIAAGVAGCLLYPLDIVRTRLIITSTSSPPRNLIPSLKALPTLSCPPELLPITILHSTIPSLFSTAVPLFVRNWFRIDPIETPTAYSITSFLIALGDLFVKLPLETVLRRGHVAVLRETSVISSPTLPLHTTGLGQNKFRTIVPVGPYKGVIGTMMSIIHEEGFRETVSISNRRQVEKRRRRGQGVAGLWRGWRVGFWALVGMWSTQSAMAGSSTHAGGEL